jgi:hypothetical protein
MLYLPSEPRYTILADTDLDEDVETDEELLPVTEPVYEEPSSPKSPTL